MPNPEIKITDLPPNVYHKMTKIPDKALAGSADTSEWVKQWELNDAHNQRAIKSAIKHNRKLQSIYNKK